MDREQKIITHFDNEAAEFDTIIQQIIPYYNQMLEALVSCIPFGTEDEFSIIDLGCGTGTISKMIQDKFPKATITCMDISEKMLDIANEKLSQKAKCIKGSFDTFEFDNSFDVVVSSLALHHLDGEQAHIDFYRKIYSTLKREGVFINIDVVKTTNSFLQDMFMEKWIDFMLENVSKNEVEDRWLKSHFEEDRPVTMMSELDALSSNGFKDIDIIYKYYNYAVYIGRK